MEALRAIMMTIGMRSKRDREATGSRGARRVSRFPSVWTSKRPESGLRQRKGSWSGKPKSRPQQRGMEVTPRGSSCSHSSGRRGGCKRGRWTHRGARRNDVWEAQGVLRPTQPSLLLLLLLLQLLSFVLMLQEKLLLEELQVLRVQQVAYLALAT